MPEINLEEFERRLRAAGSAQGGVEDPLEELTRLVNTIATDRPRDERVIDLSTVRPSRPGAAPSNDEDEPEFAPPPEAWEPAQRSLPATREDSPPPEAPLLRATFDEATETSADAEAPETFESAALPGVGSADPPVRKSSWYWKIGGLTALGLVMIAGAAAIKFGGVAVGPKTPPMILAANGPNKVAPPDEKTVQSPSDTGALLNKDSTTAGPVKVVVNQEQPADLKGADSPVAPMKDSPIIAPNQSPSIVAPPQSMAAIAPVATPAPPPAAPALPQKRPPKTVSVRPDGTLITADAAPTGTIAPAPAPAPPAAPMRKPDAAPSVTSQPASPTLDLPPAKPTKSSARVNVAKTDTTAPTEPVSAPLQLGSAATDKPAKLPTKLRPPEPQAEPQVADAAAQPAPSAGEWAVQLAAPRSDAEAQSAIQRLQTKYGSALGDTDLAVKKAEVNGETIYRVRTSGLSKAEASSLCQKLKADGGDCFVTRN